MKHRKYSWLLSAIFCAMWVRFIAWVYFFCNCVSSSNYFEKILSGLVATKDYASIKISRCSYTKTFWTLGACCCRSLECSRRTLTRGRKNETSNNKREGHIHTFVRCCFSDSPSLSLLTLLLLYSLWRVCVLPLNRLPPTHLPTYLLSSSRTRRYTSHIFRGTASFLPLLPPRYTLYINENKFLLESEASTSVVEQHLFISTLMRASRLGKKSLISLRCKISLKN